MERYSIITTKNPREIVLLRGSGCKWRRCTFCDYHLDFSTKQEENFKINSEALSKVTGLFGKLEVINSGSFCDLDKNTIQLIIDTCIKNNITTVHFECHYLHKAEVESVKELFNKYNIAVKIKTGVETFDVNYRENIMKKGFDFATPEEISQYADEVCLLFGLAGQTEESMINDIDTGLKYFDRVCINIMTPNTTKIKPDYNVISIFKDKISGKYIDNNRVDILLENTDFGVGS